ncbi:MAG: NAD(P)H-dependent glycerol-3-phosphate dehydrogenase [Hyphomicrobiaceae bacterium]
MTGFGTIAVAGAGAWGTALAQSLALSGHDVLLWALEGEVAEAVNAGRSNPVFLPDVPLSDRISATTEIGGLAASRVILMVAPAQHLRSVAAQLRGRIAAGTTVVVCAKGLEQSTGRLMGEVLAEALPEATLAVLSGPTFAAEVARGLPAAATLAMPDAEAGRQLAGAIGGRLFRIYWSDDVIGVQLGGAVKNVLAIAAGVVDGRGLGASAHAALVTRGFAELQRFGEALGAQAPTLMGLSGLGDLLLTCGSPQSRNMSLGRAIGQGQSLQAVLAGRRSVAEGVYTASAVVRRARAIGIEMPIAEAVDAIVQGSITVDAAIEGLLSRPQRPEQ